MSPPFALVERISANAESLDVLARLRMEVFREWPYLYNGDPEYEQRYLQEFVGVEDAVLVVAKVDGEPVGMATASPLATQSRAITAPLVKAGLDPSGGFYFGESVLLSAYRGLGIGHRFFDEREDAARAFGATRAVFCAVERELDHPARPQDARALEPFWRSRGYAPIENARALMSWAEIGGSAEMPHAMRLWHKHL